MHAEDHRRLDPLKCAGIEHGLSAARLIEWCAFFGWLEHHEDVSWQSVPDRDEDPCGCEYYRHVAVVSTGVRDGHPLTRLTAGLDS